MKKIIFIFLLLMLLIVPVCAESVTMTVHSKTVVGIGTGDTYPNPNDFINPMFVVSERELKSQVDYIVQEYPITPEDYCRVKIGDVITLEKPEYRSDAWRIVKIE